MEDARFTSQIFLGSGIHSLAQIGRLYQLLGQAIDLIGGLQQPPSPMEEPIPGEAESREDAELELEGVIKELFLGLSGHKISRDCTRIIKPEKANWVGFPHKEQNG